MQQKICIGLFLLSFVVNALSIQCYLCESVYDTDCGDDFDLVNYFKWDCSRVAPPRYLGGELDMRNATGCMKRTYKVGDAQRVERSCFFGDVNATTNGCQLDPALDQAAPISCHVCDNEDFCNHSNRLNSWPQYLPMMGVTLIAKLLNWLS
ncbi:UPAR/Ly6 domain-containing protein CG9338-like isoform X2 [Eurosta solidaginis]|uniref:UPAR/Ly6 domain-containing protein CG9338-like isoform X2 n=1 Tax=Eurosta solidaginis TaxID=178769 RepID=UPI00353092A3